MENIEEQYAKFKATEKKVDELYHRIAVQLGIPDSTLWVLYCLTDQDMTHTQNSIAEAMGVPKQTINSAINHLVKDEYIYLEQMAVARNSKSIHFTEKGKAYCQRIIQPILDAEKNAENRLSEEEQKIYLALSIKHNQFLQEEFAALLANLRGETQ